MLLHLSLYLFICLYISICLPPFVLMFSSSLARSVYILPSLSDLRLRLSFRLAFFPRAVLPLLYSVVAILLMYIV